MNVKEFIKRYGIILFLSFLVVVLIVVRFSYKNLPNNQKITPVLTPTVVPTSFPEEYIDEINEE